MKIKSLFTPAILLCSLVLIFNISITANALAWQNQIQNTTVPEAEAKAFKALETAPDINAKVAAAEAFVKKYPASKVPVSEQRRATLNRLIA